MISKVRVWGLPFAPFRRREAADAVVELMEAGRPAFFITANTHYAMLTEQHPELLEVNERAAFLIADGAPIVWASRGAIPERVAGAGLLFDLCELAAERGHRVFFLGGREGVAVEAADRLRALYPGLQIVGTACPPHRELSEEEHEALLAEIREARPNLLIVAYGQPKGELWIDRNLARLGPVVCVQVGASLDFVAGQVRRAPAWIGKLGMEWAFRLAMEPRRLAPRYVANARFLARKLLLGGRRGGSSPEVEGREAPIIDGRAKPSNRVEPLTES